MMKKKQSLKLIQSERKAKTCCAAISSQQQHEEDFSLTFNPVATKILQLHGGPTSEGWVGGWNATERRVDLGQGKGDNLILHSVKPVKDKGRVQEASALSHLS